MERPSPERLEQILYGPNLFRASQLEDAERCIQELIAEVVALRDEVSELKGGQS